jgi:hypothetical protein
MVGSLIRFFAGFSSAVCALRVVALQADGQECPPYTFFVLVAVFADL